MVRLRDYFETDGKTTVGVSYSWSADDQYQMQRGPLPDQWLLVKGYGAPAAVEEFRIIDGAICRGHDTSMQGNEWYQLVNPPQPVSEWLPAEMNVGDYFLREPIVVRYNRATGQETFRGPHRTWALLKSRGEWRGAKNLRFTDVIEVHVFDGDAGKASGKPFEIYHFGKGAGPVSWEGDVAGEWHTMKANAIFNGPILIPAPLPAGKQYQPMATTPVTPPPADPAAWYWHRPVRAPFSVTSPFGERLTPEQNDGDKTELHNGTDYAGLSDWNAYAAREGKVIFAGWNEYGYGNLVTIDHGDGYQSLYGHLESASVTVGATVSAGQKIGVIGSTGRSTARHLHLGTRRNGVFYAPAPEMRPHLLDIAPPPVTPPVTPEPPPIVTIPLPELSPDPAVRAQTVAVLRWLADIIEAAP